jgi:hypothetical protein
MIYKYLVCITHDHLERGGAKEKGSCRKCNPHDLGWQRHNCMGHVEQGLDQICEYSVIVLNTL